MGWHDERATASFWAAVSSGLVRGGQLIYRANNR